MHIFTSNYLSIYIKSKEHLETWGRVQLEDRPERRTLLSKMFCYIIPVLSLGSYVNSAFRLPIG